MGISVIACNSCGLLIFAVSKALPRSSSTEIAQAIAMFQGVLEFSRRDLGRVIFERDCLGVINLLSSGHNNQANISNVIRDIFHSSVILDYSFDFVPRNSNRAAHVLTCRALVNGANNR